MNLSSSHLDTQFFLRPNNDGSTGSIYVRAVYGSTRIEIGSTGLRLPQKFWDARRRCVKASYPDAEAVNYELDRWRLRIDAARLDLLRKGRETITAGSIKAHLLSDQNGPLTMTGLLDWYIEHRKKEVPMRLAKSSLDAFARRGRSVKAFLTHARLTQQLADEFTPDVADRLVHFLSTEKGHCNAYVNKILDVVRAALRAAADAERISKNPLKKYADLPEGDPDTTHLTAEEIARCEALTDLSPGLEKVRDFLLFCVEAGTHYADYAGIRKQGRIENDPDGSRWLVSKRQKTNKPIEVPVTPRMERLVEKYGGLDGLPLLANAQLNAFLKVIAEKAGITKNVTTKIGRKSFADARLNHDALSDTATATMLGLTSTAYLQHYGTVRRDRLKKELNARRNQLK